MINVACTPTDQANSIDFEEEDVVVVFEVTEDLILEILSHLPPTSLLRFKSVSKTWYSLISNPDFLRRNTANQFNKRITTGSSDFNRYIYNIKNIPRILTLVLTPPIPNDDYDELAYYCFHQKISPLVLEKLIDFRGGNVIPLLMVIDSCNGLLLFKKIIKYSVTPAKKYDLYVCNPITHDYIELPTFEQIEREQGFRILDYLSLNIVFDPSVSLTYKVVTLLTCTTTEKKGQKHYGLYVYSSETRSWRLSVSTDHQISVNGLINKRGVLCNGVLYWRDICLFYDTNASLCYDVEKDVICTLKFPKMPLECNQRVLLYFGECGGRLRLIETYYKLGGKMNVFRFIFDVMELDNNDDSWTVKYHVNILNDLKGHYANLIGGVHILDIYKTKTKKAAGEYEIDQGEEEELLMRIGNICIMSFNLSSNKVGKELRNGEKKSADELFLGSYFTDILRYNPTLFPPSLSS